MMSIALAVVAQVILMFGNTASVGVALALLIFFTAFNVLEATLPSMISKIAPLAAKGTAMGVYQQRAVSRRILRRGSGRRIDAVCRRRCRIRVRYRAVVGVADRRIHDAASGSGAHQALSFVRNE